jgi:hypothetical protein
LAEQIPRELPDLENIALGASCAFDPAPNYQLCTDPGDAVQLTDGVYTVGYFWTQASTVGWSNAVPVITLDLGTDQPIRGISYNTAAGVAGVSWPRAIHLFIAGEDGAFHEAGELVALHRRHESPPAEEYAVHRFWTDELHTHGRYLALAVVASPFVFVDEIEVFAGEAAWLEEPIPGQAVDELRDGTWAAEVQAGRQRRFIGDMQALLDKADSIGVSAAVRDEILCEWDSVLEALAEEEVAPDFRAVLPYGPLHERVLAVQARLWGEEGRQGWTVWQTPPWEHLPYLVDPPHEASLEMQVHVMQAEFRAGSINLTNATSRPRIARLRLEGLPGGNDPPWVTIHQVEWTDTADGEPVADALPEAARADGDHVVRVPSGFTRQVWLTFHPVDVPAGDYVGSIVVDDGSEIRRVPLSVYVHPYAFPAAHRLHLGGWDYVNGAGARAVTEENRELLVTHLREHFVDRPWATSTVMPAGQYDSAGQMITPPDTTEFDSWLELWAGADRYQVFAAVSSSFAGLAAGTEQFDAAVGQWAQFWSDHALESGLASDQLAVLLVDEPHAAEQDSTILAWANAILVSGANLLIWEDPTYQDMRDADPRMIAACDVLCPNRQIFLQGGDSYAQYFAEQLAAGKTLEFYSCSGPVRHLDPYYYHRLQAWTAWQHGATAMSFWAFSDTGGGSPWNEYGLPGRVYAPSFVDDTSVVTSKHMEAVREGLEDYEYLAMLRDAIVDAEARGAGAAVLQGARELLADLPGRVLPPPETSIDWREPLDRTVADVARLDVLEMLAALAP